MKIKNFWEWLLLGVALALIDYYCWNRLIDGSQSPTLAQAITGIIAFIGLILVNRRLQNQDKQIQNQNKQIKIQMNQRIDDRFTSAINLLGSGESSARAGAIYSLYHLAVEETKYRKEVVQILCSHIRTKTQEKKYQDEHRDGPSSEIQTTLNLLFQKEMLYDKFKNELEIPNLRSARLNGVDLVHAQLQGANLEYTQLYGADLSYAQLQGAILLSTQLQGAILKWVELQGAILEYAQLQGAILLSTQLQGAILRKTQLQGAHSGMNNYFLKNLIGKNTDLTEAIFQGEISEKIVKQIEKSKEYFIEYQYNVLKEIIDKNKGKKPSNEPTKEQKKGMVTGRLENSGEIPNIIEALKEIDKKRDEIRLPIETKWGYDKIET